MINQYSDITKRQFADGGYEALGSDWQLAGGKHMEAIQVMFIMGLPTLALLGVGIWALKRETKGVVRAFGYSLVAFGIVAGILTVAMLVNGPLSTTGFRSIGG